MLVRPLEISDIEKSARTRRVDFTRRFREKNNLIVTVRDVVYRLRINANRVASVIRTSTVGSR